MYISLYQLRILYNDKSKRIINVTREFYLNDRGELLSKDSLVHESLSVCCGRAYKIFFIYEGEVIYEYTDKINKPGSKISKFVKLARNVSRLKNILISIW